MVYGIGEMLIRKFHRKIKTIKQEYNSATKNKESNLVFSKKEALHLFVQVNLREYEPICKKKASLY